MHSPPDRYERHPILQSFIDSAVEEAYASDFYDQHKAYSRWVFASAIMVVILYGLIERALFPNRYLSFWLVRYGFLLPALLAFMPVVFFGRGGDLARRYLQEISGTAFAMQAVGLGVLTWMQLSTVRNEDVLYFGLAFSIAAVFPYLVLRLRFVYASILAWAITIGAIGAMLSNGLHQGFGFIAVATQGVMLNALGMTGAWLLEDYSRRNFVVRQRLDAERNRAEGLLLNVLPIPIADRLKLHESPIADRFEHVTVVFADIAGFTPLARTMAPQAMVAMLNSVFSAFDAMADEEGVEKIKTIGDAYMAASGIPHARDDHAQAAARLALRMRDWLAGQENFEGLQLRIGVHTGPVVAGVIGRRKFAYDLWGSTVNLASRMETHGVPGSIQVTEDVRVLLSDAFTFEHRGEVAIKGLGSIATWWLLDGPSR